MGHPKSLKSLSKKQDNTKLQSMTLDEEIKFIFSPEVSEFQPLTLAVIRLKSIMLLLTTGQHE